MKAATRIYALLAREANVGVIFRRGPSKQVLLIKWDTAKDTFEYGQWFKGRIYERRCDLSPGGNYLIYFAASFKQPLYSWTAISKPPFLKALALWPKGECWNGGGQFVSQYNIVLNHERGEAKLHPDYKANRIRIVQHAKYRGEDDTVYHSLLERDGWKFVSKAKWEQVGSGIKSYWKGEPPEIWTKSHPKAKLNLEMRQVSIGKRDSGWYEVEYNVIDNTKQETLNLGFLDWADWDQRGDLVYAKQGKLYRQKMKGRSLEPAVCVADFTDLKFEAVEAPAWAEKW